MFMRFVLPSKVLFAFTILLLAVLAAGFGYIYLPKAIIEIGPAQEVKSISQEIRLSTATDAPDFKRFILPARVVEKAAEKEERFERDASTKFDDFARGRVTLVNEQNEAQELLPKTHLRYKATGVLFLTDSGVAIPPQGETGVTVTAKEKGASGNVDAGEFIVDKLPARLQSVIYGKSEQGFSGGVAVDKPVTEDEIEKNTGKLWQSMRESIAGELTSAAGGASLREDLTAYTDDLVAVSVPIGSKASSYSIKAKVTGKAFLVDENDLLGLTLLKLRTAAGPQQEFVAYDPKTFSVTMLRADFDRGEAVVEGTIDGSFASKIGPRIFNDHNLAGLDEPEIIEELKKNNEVGEVKVKFFPFWVRSVPSRVGGTEIVVRGVK